MNNIFQKILLICLIAIGFTNMNARELLNPKSTIIDIGYTKPQKNYDVNVSPDWVYYSSLSKLTDKLIQSKERVLSERFDCEIDYLGRENCSIQQVDCTALLQQDDGFSVLTKKTHQISPVKSKVAKNSCSSNSYRGCENTSLFFMKGCQWGYHLAANWYGCGKSYARHPHHWSDYGYFGDDYARMMSVRNSFGRVKYEVNYKPYETCLTYDTYSFTCPTDYKIRKISSMNFICEKDYSYYEYKCKTDTNNYDRPWLGPVIDAGGDCEAQCGPNGCICNSQKPPKNNCVRDDFVCPFDKNQLCTITTDDKKSTNNIINGFIYENGTSKTYRSTVIKEKTCPNDLIWNKNTDSCETSVKYECTKSGFVYDSNLNECIKPIECLGEVDINGVCIEKPDSICPTGYIFNSSLNFCVSNPVCDRGIYNTTTNLCEETASCPKGFEFNEKKKRCEQYISYELLSCSIGDMKEGLPRYCETTPNADNSCPKDYVLKDSSCVKDLVCPTGYLQDTKNNVCVKIESGMELILAENLFESVYVQEFECVGGLSDSRVCSYLPTCNGTGLLDIKSDRCIIVPDFSCSEEVTAKCAEGSYYKDGKCLALPVCPNGTSYNYDRNVCTFDSVCEEGFSLNSKTKKCEKKVASQPYKCLTGETLINGEVDVCKINKVGECPAEYRTSSDGKHCERDIVCPEDYPNIDYKNNKCLGV